MDNSIKPAFNASPRQIGEQDIVSRIWRRDYTLWKPDPDEISNRLGWLTVSDHMRQMVPDLRSFGREIREEGYNRVILLGMGGSSLGAEVIRGVFGNTGRLPELIILDSIVPEAVRHAASGLDLKRTLFLVSSKSGTTSEPLALFHYFRGMARRVMDKNKVGRNFVAITDPAAPLVQLANNEGFRRVFINPPDIGGRYSVLSLFGLAPAALLGRDIDLILDRVDRAMAACAPRTAENVNPGFLLGKLLAMSALDGRNKLTLITSPRLSSFGLWVEQLVAESTGKEGKGILPVTGEPMANPRNYGTDRIFVYLRLNGDDNEKTDAMAERLKADNLPVTVRLLDDVDDLWSEFYYWEFATAVAGVMLGINPFDQPDVQGAKDSTRRLLKEYSDTGSLPVVANHLTVNQLLNKAGNGKYIAIMAYIRQTPWTDELFSDFRRKVIEKYRLATTLGYGPRFLHSTGQLHKGGPDQGLFIRITTDHRIKLKVPGEAYSLAVLADAEAAGDLEALVNKHRPVASIHLPAGERAMLSALKKALDVH